MGKHGADPNSATEYKTDSKHKNTKKKQIDSSKKRNSNNPSGSDKSTRSGFLSSTAAEGKKEKITYSQQQQLKPLSHQQTSLQQPPWTEEKPAATGGNCAFGSRPCNKDRQSQDPAHGGRSNQNDRVGKFGAGAKDTVGANGAKNVQASVVQTQTRNASSAKPGCDVTQAQKGPLKLLKPHHSNNGEEGALDQTKESGSGPGPGHGRKHQNYRKLKKLSNSSYNDYDYDDNDAPLRRKQQTKATHAQTKNKSVGDSPVCAAVPLPSKLTQTIGTGTNEKYKVLSKFVNEHDESGTGPDRRNTSAHASRSHGKSRKSTHTKQGESQSESPTTSLLYVLPRNASTSSAQPSVVPKERKKTGSHAQAQQSKALQRKSNKGESRISEIKELLQAVYSAQKETYTEEYKATRSGAVEKRSAAPSRVKTAGKEQSAPAPAPAPAQAPHLKCCAPGEEGGKDCVVCKPYVAQTRTGPVTIKYRAIIVDAKPSLGKISKAPSQIENDGSEAGGGASSRPQSRPKSRKVPPTVVVSRLAHSQVSESDPIDNAFQNIVDNNTPMVWVFGYTQSALVKNKAECIDVIASKNNLAVIDLSGHVERWLGPPIKDKDKSSKQDKHSRDLRDLYDRIRERAKNILSAHKIKGAGYKDKNKKEGQVQLQGGQLPIEDLCELVKLCIVSAMNPYAPNSNPPLAPPSGVIIDNFPLSIQEGMEAEALLYKCRVCLYFSSVAWSGTKDKDKDKNPPLIKPAYHLREEPYSEQAAEKGAEFFGFKTIKVINAEDLEDIQITDINSLVKQHLDGHGLNLHRIKSKRTPLKGEDSASTTKGHDRQYTKSGETFTTIGHKSNKSQIVSDSCELPSKDQSKSKSTIATEVNSGQIDIPNVNKSLPRK